MKNLPLYIIAAVILFLVYLVYFHIPPENNSAEYLYWGRLHIVLSSLPIIFYFSGFGKKNIFPFIAFVALYQVIGFGLPVFFIRITSFQMNDVLDINAMRYAFWGLVIFYATFFFLYPYVFQRQRPYSSIPKSLDPIYLNTLTILVLLIYFFSRYFGMVAIRHLGTFSLFVYIGFSLTKALRKRMNLWETLIFFAVLGFELVDRVTSGLIAELAMFLLFLCLVIFLEGSKKYLVAVFLTFFIIFYSQFANVKGTYRSIAWFGGKQLSYEEKVSLIAELIERDEKKASTEEDKQGKENFLWRFSYPMAALSMVITKTPDPVPYWDGITYLPLFTKFIPRVIWPDKPEEGLGQRFGKTYKIIRERDTSTSINTPVLTELYMNFGLNGFYIGMFCLGLLFIFLDKFLNSNSVDYENQIVNISILFPVMIMESNFSLTYGNVVLICISLYLIFRFIKK